VTTWLASDGTTVKTMCLVQTSDPADEGWWLVPKWPNGYVRATTTNQRGWVRTPEELAALGIDLGSLVEICPSCNQLVRPNRKAPDGDARPPSPA
jgi:hypothetical protein